MIRKLDKLDLLRHNSPAELLIAAGAAAAVLCIVWLIRTVARWRLRTAAETETPLDDFFLDLAHRTKMFLLVFPALLLAERFLTVDREVTKFLVNATTLSLIAQVALWVSGLVDFWLGRYKRALLQTDPGSATTIGAFRFAAVTAVWLLALLGAMHNLGVEVGPLVAGLGIGGVAVALALQNVLGDLFASLSIVLDKPFVIGDAITVDTHTGIVERIGLKTTRLRSVNGEQLIFSNGDLLRSRIRNWKRLVERRSLMKIGVEYSTPADTLARIPSLLRSAVEAQPSVRFDRAHLVNFGESALEFELAYFVATSDYGAFLEVQQAVSLGIIRAFEESSISFAFPTRTLYVRSEAQG
jgi:small-conductance mechanosensitive channel